MSVATEYIKGRGTFACSDVQCAGCGRFGRWMFDKLMGAFWCLLCGGDRR